MQKRERIVVQGEPWMGTGEVTRWAAAGNGPGAPVDSWVLRWVTAPLSLLLRLARSDTPHSVHAAINIKRHQRSDWETGLRAGYSSELGSGSRMSFSLPVPAPALSLQKVGWVMRIRSCPAGCGGWFRWSHPERTGVLALFMGPPEQSSTTPQAILALATEPLWASCPAGSILGQKYKIR